MTVVGVARKAAHADHEPFGERGCHADLAAELIAHPGLPFGDAIHLGLVQVIDLVGPLGLLMQRLRHRGEFGGDPFPQAALRDVLQVAAQVTYDAARIPLQPFQCFSHTLELLGMGMSANL